jgi:hypothetical protein
MNAHDLEDVRTHARVLLQVQQGMTRDEFIAQVRSYAAALAGKEGELHGARTARYVWDSAAHTGQ